MSTPPLPPGYVLDNPQAVPPLPPGYKLDSDTPSTPQPNQGLPPGQLPMSSYTNATLQGFANIGEGVQQAGEGMYNMVRHPIDTARAMAQLPKQALQVPGAIKDIATAPGPAPLGEYGRIVGNAAGQTVATAAMSEAPGIIKDVVKGAGSKTLLLGRTPAEAYQSALKPSTTLSEAQRAAIIKTGLQEKIPVSVKGLQAIGDRIDDLNQQITSKINTGASQGVTVNPKAVAARTASTTERFSTQVNPEADLSAIEASKAEFLRNNPNAIPIERAQAMKQGTYQVLRGKYGEQGSAAVEAQKALARGLKEEIAANFPEIKDLNAAESRLLNLQPVLERAVNRIGNHQLLGIGTPIAAGAVKAVTGSGKLGAAAGLLKAVLDDPVVKSRLAIALSRRGVPAATSNARIAAYQSSLGYLAAGLPTASSGDTPNQKTDEQP